MNQYTSNIFKTMISELWVRNFASEFQCPNASGTATENLCVSERDALALWAPQGEKPRSCSDNQFSWWGGTLCEGNHLGPCPGADREGLSGPMASAQERRPLLRRLPGRDPARLHVGRSLWLDFLACQPACDVRVSSRPHLEVPAPLEDRRLPSRS